MIARKSLRLRLTIALSAMVGLILVVGLVSYATHAGVRSGVRELRASDVFDLNNVDLKNTGLEIEGYWNPAGSFVATDIEPKPPLDPRLRGEIQRIDAAAGTITIYGIDVAVTAQTENGDDEDQPVRFASLRSGQRVEVPCIVENGRWQARKLYARDVKASDKVKGMVTRTALDGRVPESIFIHDLEIVVEPRKGGGTKSALNRIEQATLMILEVEKCRAEAHSLVGDAARSQDIAMAAAARLEAAQARFVEILRSAYAEGDDPMGAPLDGFRAYLDELTSQQSQLRRHVNDVIRLARGGDEAALVDQLHGAFDPFLAQEIRPILVSYLGLAREELGDELRRIEDLTETTPMLALGGSAVALIAALLLGFWIWGSIQRPLQRLQAAAVELGHGRLDTRIEIRNRDELGLLAETFNRMASELATTTVSRESLESVFDSMAAVVIVFDSAGRIVNVNQATRDLLGHPLEELIGREFDVICKFGVNESVAPLLTGSAAGTAGAAGAAGAAGVGASILERVFVRDDGTELPVALSGAELRSAGGVQGYVCVAQDLSEQKRIEAQIRQSLADKELLLREVHHRVKNNMQVISSLLAMQTSGGDPEVVRRLQESQNRIRTIALIHEQLYRSAELAHIDIATYLDVLTNHLLQSFGALDTVQLQLELDEVGLDVDESLSVGLIVNELVTNSLKYAFTESDGRGQIRIELRNRIDGSRELVVADDGRGIAEDRPAGPPTLGTSLVATLARQLRGKVEVDGTNGTTTRIVFGAGAGAAVAS